MSEFRPHEVEWTPEKVARMWDYFASNPAYDDRYFSAHSGSAIVAHVLHDRSIELTKSRVLDFGCGRGDLLAALYSRGIPAQGLEFSEDSVAEVKRRFAGNPLFLDVGFARKLPCALDAGSFDVVFLVEVVEHLLDEQLRPTLTEVRRLVRAGGVVVVTCPNGERLEAGCIQCPDCGGVFHRWQHVRSLTAESIGALFGEYGFETRIATGVFWGLTPMARLRTRIRRPRQPLPKPHLLYVGVAR